MSGTFSLGYGLRSVQKATEQYVYNLHCTKLILDSYLSEFLPSFCVVRLCEFVIFARLLLVFSQMKNPSSQFERWFDWITCTAVSNVYMSDLCCQTAVYSARESFFCITDLFLDSRSSLFWLNQQMFVRSTDGWYDECSRYSRTNGLFVFTIQITTNKYIHIYN